MASIPWAIITVFVVFLIAVAPFLSQKDPDASDLHHRAKKKTVADHRPL